MAQTFTYTVKAAIPLPPGVAAAYYDASATIVELTGPTSSVAGGMLIADADDDWSTIIGLWEIEGGDEQYRLRFDAGTSNSSTTGKIVVVNATTGAALTSDTDLDAVTWTAVVLGKGPEASKLDL